MVDVSSKEPTKRTATASGRIHIPRIAYELISERESCEAPQISVVDKELQRRKEKAKSKGDVLTVAQLAGIMASKRTADLIPLCHPLALSHVSVTLTLENASIADAVGSQSIGGGDQTNDEKRQYSIFCEATVSCEGKTGVEMEALTAVSVSLLTVWDMLKAVAGKDMVIDNIKVIRKIGGKSGDFTRTL